MEKIEICVYFVLWKFSVYSKVLRSLLEFSSTKLHFSCVQMFSAGKEESGAVGLPTALHLVIVYHIVLRVI